MDHFSKYGLDDSGATLMFIGLQYRITEPETTFFLLERVFNYFAVICYCLKLDEAWHQSTGRLLLKIPSAFFSKPVLRIPINLDPEPGFWPKFDPDPGL